MMAMVLDYARALLAGMVALTVNFLLLGLADGLGIVNVRGGFQRLVKLWTAPLLQSWAPIAPGRRCIFPIPRALYGFKVAVASPWR